MEDTLKHIMVIIPRVIYSIFFMLIVVGIISMRTCPKWEHDNKADKAVMENGSNKDQHLTPPPDAYDTAVLIFGSVVFPLAVILETENTLGLVIGVYMYMGIMIMCDTIGYNNESGCSSPFLTLIGLVTIHLFFMTGHKSTLAALPIRAAFVGLTRFVGPVSTVLTVSHLNASYLLGIACVAVCMAIRHGNDKRIFIQNIGRVYAIVISYNSIRQTFWMISLLMLRRHLQIWNVFSPKFLIESVNHLYFGIVCICNMWMWIYGTM
eukprot:GHVO01051512.1.p1 GENE.GHVO01051512.1~~GHVO01051512.1.p1  ORF type:complete len:265 (-),score=36.76 GHVO01051512.1:31-825(-)